MRIAGLMALTVAVFGTLPRSAPADSPAPRLGTLRIHAWLGPPTMPAISLTRGPLQQIIETVRPESIRGDALAWEGEITRHRRLLRAGSAAVAELRAHYRHQILVRPDEAASLKQRMTGEQQRLERRFGQEAAERSDRLRAREATIRGAAAGAPTEGVEAPNAAAQLLLAEIELARQLRAFDRLHAKWETARARYVAGELSDAPSPPQPYLDTVIQALKRVESQAPARLTRDRVAQLLAVVHVENGDPESAIRTLSAVLKRRVSWELRAELQNRLGDLLLGQGRFAGAARIYGQLDKTGGTWLVRAQLGLAWCRYRLGDADGALAAVQMARERLKGTFDGAAVALQEGADLLYIQLLADGRRSVPASLSPRLREAVLALRNRQAQLVALAGTGAGQDKRAGALVRQARSLRDCYREWLRESPESTVSGVVALMPGRNATLVRLDPEATQLRACLQKGLSRVRSPRNGPSAMLALELIPVAVNH